MDESSFVSSDEGVLLSNVEVVSKLNEKPLKSSEKRRQIEEVPFQPTLHARRMKETSGAGGSRFDRLYDDAIKRQTIEPKPRMDENQLTFTPSISPKARSASADRRSTDFVNSMHKASGAGGRIVAKEIPKDPSTFKPTISKRASSMDRSPSVSATVARLYASKDIPKEKADVKKKDDSKKITKIDTNSPMVSPKARTNSMVFTENVGNGKSLSAADRLRLHAENRKNQLDLEKALQGERDMEGLTFQPKLATKSKIAAASEPKTTAHSESIGRRGRDIVVKAVTGSRFDSLYKDAMKRKNDDPAVKNDNNLTFKPLISPKARSLSRDRSASEQINNLHTASGAGRVPVKKPTDVSTVKPSATKRSTSVDRTAVDVTKRLNALKELEAENAERLRTEASMRLIEECTFRETSEKSLRCEEEKQRLPVDTLANVDMAASDVASGAAGSSQEPQSDPTLSAAVEQKAEHPSTEDLSDISKLVTSFDDTTLVGLKREEALPQKKEVELSGGNEHVALKRASSTDGANLELIDLQKKAALKKTEITAELRSKDSNISPKMAPFRSPGMRSRSTSIDDRRWSVGSTNSSSNCSSASSPTTASMAGRFKEIAVDAAKLKADDSRRLRAEKDLANMKAKNLKAEKEMVPLKKNPSSSNILRGGTSFGITPSSRPTSLTAESAAALGSPDRPSRASSDLTPPSRPGMPFGRCV